MSLTIVQILPALEVGGVEKGTLEVSQALVKRGHRSIVISAGGRMVAKLKEEGGEHIDWPVGKKSLLTLRYVRRLAEFLQQEKVDVVHARSRLPAWILYLALRKIPASHRPALVTTVHGPYSVSAYSAIMTRGDRVIAISEFIRNYIHNNYKHVDDKKITVIHRGISKTDYAADYKPSAEWLQRFQQEYPASKNKFIITTPARITRWKGQEDFLRITAKLLGKGMNVHGLIAGAPHPRRAAFLDELINLAGQLGISEHVSFIGHRDDMKDVMAMSDVVFSLAREPEAFGRTALEALSLGVPVIAYDHGGASEVLNVMFPQGLIAPLDIDAAADRCLLISGQADDICMEHPFTLDNMLAQIIQIYEQAALNNEGKPA